MVTDYEQAWIRLQAFVASKTQHGREGLLTEMATIAAECRIPAGELSRLLRLYGIEVERARAMSIDTADGSGSPGGGLVSSSDASAAAHHRTEEVHDGGRNTAGSAARERLSAV